MSKKLPLSVFCSYAHEDEQLRRRLEQALAEANKDGLIKAVWYDGQIGPGMEWHREIQDHLESADLILLLVSPDFLASEYCSGVEVLTALERHAANEARVIPII